MSCKQFKVLSLDGGGARGYLTALILENIENYLNSRQKEVVPVGQRFDLVVGTSTGGIIALALAAGYSAKDIREFYEKNIPRIFSCTQRASKLSQLFRPKYESTALQCALVEFFGERTLNDVQTDVCITAVALRSGKPKFYKSDYLIRNSGRSGELLSGIALATSSAPTYFKSTSLKYSDNLVDGGICANNPAVVALVEACQFERSSKRNSIPARNLATDIALLSIGTGEQPRMPYDIEDVKTGGQLNWAPRITDLLLESQSELIHLQSKFLLGENYLRINPLLKFAMALDDIERLNELKNLSDLTKDYETYLKKFF